MITPWYVPLSIGVGLLILCVLIRLTTYRNKLPSYLVVVCFISFSISIVWIWFISTLLVDILNVTGLILDIPTSFLGLTFLAFGNSCPDLSLDTALAKNGYGEMAMAGAVAGPLFNLLVGFGISLVKTNINM